MLLKFAELLHNILGSQISPLSDMNFQKISKALNASELSIFENILKQMTLRVLLWNLKNLNFLEKL